MPRPSKSLTSRKTLRMTDAEASVVGRERARYAESGVRLSENDTLRAMIRRAGRPRPATAAAARRAVEQHRESCEDCLTGAHPCPDVVDLRDDWAALRRIQR
jgi:hypothetical protein